MKVIFKFAKLITFKKKLKEFLVIETKTSGKIPEFQGNFSSAHFAGFQGKILLKQKRYSFFAMLKQMERSIHKL